MGVEKIAKGLFSIAAVLVIACLLMPVPSLARTEARYELRTGDAVFGNDLYSSRGIQSIFHQQTANYTDRESLAIDFPPLAEIPGTKTVLGPTSVSADGVQATANVIPFGLVNLAFPSIDETVDQSYAVTDTGYYNSNFLGIPPPNEGAYPVVTGPAAFSSPVSPPLSIAGPSAPFSEMYNIMPGYERQKAINTSNAQKAKSATAAQNAAANATTSTGNNSIQVNQSLLDLPINGSVVRAQQAGRGTSQTIAGQEVAGAETAVPMNYTGLNVQDSQLSYPYFPFNAKASQISNMSLLDRMWRNSHLGTMGRAYEGDTSYPTWILPTEFTKSAISMYNWYDVNNMALAYTMPGMHIEQRFWDLGITDPYSPSYNIIPGMVNKVASPSQPATDKLVSNKSLNVSVDDFLRNQSINGRSNTSSSANATGNVTSGGNKTSAAKPATGPEMTKIYIPAGGPAGQGQGYPTIIKGPFQKGWVGGTNDPWVIGASTNPLFPGMGGPDWPPYYWGFGRYKGW